MQTTNPWVAWHCNAVSVTHATWQISLRRLRTSEELHPEVRPKDHWSNVPRQRPSPPHQLDCTARTSHSSDTHFSLSSLRSLVCKQDAIYSWHEAQALMGIVNWLLLAFSPFGIERFSDSAYWEASTTKPCLCTISAGHLIQGRYNM